jgi:hypothetical protein
MPTNSLFNRRIAAGACAALALSTLSLASAAQTPPQPVPAPTKAKPGAAVPAATPAPAAAPGKAPAATASNKTATPAAAATTAAVAPAKAAAPAEVVERRMQFSSRPLPYSTGTPKQQAKVVKLMTEELKLTPGQEKRVNAVYDQQRADIAAIRAKPLKGHGASRVQAEAIQDAREIAEAKLSGILSEQQMKQWMFTLESKPEKYRASIQKRLDQSQSKPAG